MFSGTTGAIVASVLKADPSKYKPFVQTFLVICSDIAFWYIPLAAILTAAAQYIKKQLSPWYWDTIKLVLDHLSKDIFGDRQANAYEDRVTLFRHFKWKWCCKRWPWSGWLIPVERSGHVTRSSKIIFKAPQQGDEAQGIAGQSWAQNLCVHTSQLPDITSESQTVKIGRYCKETFCAEEWVKDQVKKGKKLPRSIVGIPVESKAGKVWGVIVIDSRSETILTQGQIEAFYRQHASVLSKLLEKV